MFFEFMIALFVHELLSRKLVILFFNSIHREIDENSRKMFDFKRSFFFLIIFHFEKANFEFVIEIVNDAVDELMMNRNTLKTIYDSLTKYNRIRICRTCFVFCFFFSTYSALRRSCDVFTIFARFAHFILFND
jgi:hypothetical protein